MSTHFDATTASCRVYTFKEGLLSRVAHDLELRVERFSVTAEASTVTATFAADSLRVVSAWAEGRPTPGALSASDCRKIEATVAQEILQVGRFPEIRFRSSRIEGEGDRRQVEGILELCGRSRSLQMEARQSGDRWRLETTLLQPDFGIKPYSAMFGALRIKPELRVELELPVG